MYEENQTPEPDASVNASAIIAGRDAIISAMQDDVDRQSRRISHLEWDVRNLQSKLDTAKSAIEGWLDEDADLFDGVDTDELFEALGIETTRTVEVTVTIEVTATVSVPRNWDDEDIDTDTFSASDLSLESATDDADIQDFSYEVTSVSVN